MPMWTFLMLEANFTIEDKSKHRVELRIIAGQNHIITMRGNTAERMLH
jgi:hypothetical protein